mmetsp:Transcript_31639/g.90817  ORF Transcript_31639/g.90817 Transcript_31639/m.90817 type:complete len:228 (+) Transcript_31639:86-769(+)
MGSGSLRTGRRDALRQVSHVLLGPFEDADVLPVEFLRDSQVEEELGDVLPVNLKGQLPLRIVANLNAAVVLDTVNGRSGVGEAVVLEVALLICKDGGPRDDDVELRRVSRAAPLPRLLHLKLGVLHVRKAGLEHAVRGQAGNAAAPRSVGLAAGLVQANAGHGDELWHLHRGALFGHLFQALGHRLHARGHDPLGRLHHAQEAHDHVSVCAQQLPELCGVRHVAAHD